MDGEREGQMVIERGREERTLTLKSLLFSGV